jgi:hypothetical protein
LELLSFNTSLLKTKIEDEQDALILQQGEMILFFPIKGIDIKSPNQHIELATQIIINSNINREFKTFIPIENNRWNFDISLKNHIISSEENADIQIKIKNNADYSLKFKIFT